LQRARCVAKKKEDLGENVPVSTGAGVIWVKKGTREKTDIQRQSRTAGKKKKTS